MNKNRGFTLIETIIYVALFSIIMGGLLITAFSLYQNNSDTSNKVVIQEEINFVLKKIDWALADAETINVPTSLSPNSDTLNVDKTDYNDNPVIIRYNNTSDNIEFCTVSCEDLPNAVFSSLTSENVDVDSLAFKFIEPVGTGPAGIEVTLSINGIVSVVTKYQKI